MKHTAESRPIEAEAVNRLYELLQTVPFIAVSKPVPGSRMDGELFPTDGFIQVHHGRSSWWVVLEVKRNAQLRDARISIDYLNKFIKALPKGYPVFVSQYISPPIREFCIKNNVGYFDFSGNCRIVFDDIFIEKESNSSAPEKKRLKSLFSSKSSRVIRRLLIDPKQLWKVQTLARESSVSMATVSLVKDKLLGEEYATREGEAFFITKPEKLLLDWAQNYNSHQHKQIEYFGHGEVGDLEDRLSRECRKQAIEYAFTTFSGARRVANFTRGIQRGYAYISANTAIQELASSLDFKMVSSGGNFRLITLEDTDLLFGKQEINGDVVVSDIQLYLDLAGHKGRGEENAEFLLEQRIRPRWQ